MKSRDEISSTDKLLNLIKGEAQDQPSPEVETAGDTRESIRRYSAPKGSLRGKKNVNLGVDIAPDAIRMVKVSHLSEKRFRVLDKFQRPIPPGVGRDDSAFIELLRLSLDEFSGRRRYDIWVPVSSLDADIRHMVIPKVPKNQQASVVYWNLKKETSFEEPQIIFDYEICGEVVDKGVEKTAVIAYTVFREKAFQLQKLFELAGYELSGITPPSFGIQNLFRTGWLAAPDATTAVLYIGEDRSRIDIFSSGNLLLTRGIKAGMKSMAEALSEAYNEKWRTSSLSLDSSQEFLSMEDEPVLDFSVPEPQPSEPEIVLDISEEEPVSGLESPASVSEDEETGGVLELGDDLTILTEWDEQESQPTTSVEHEIVMEDEPGVESPQDLPVAEEPEAGRVGFKEPREPQSVDSAQARRLLLAVSGQLDPVDPEEPGFDLDDKSAFDLCLPAVERLVRQLERTLTHYHNIQTNERVGKLLLSGPVTALKPLVDYISDQLGVESAIADPLAPGTPFLGDLVPPKTEAERSAFTLPLCLALSTNERTPNILYSHEIKEKQDAQKLVNRAILGGFLVFLSLILGVFFWQGQQAEDKKDTIVSLSGRIADCGADLNQAVLTDMGKQLVDINRNIKEYSRKHLGMGIINEISRQTPKNIRLLAITADLDLKRASTKLKKSNGRAGIVVEGLVTGQRSLLESSLATYVMRLESSPLFQETGINSTSVEIFGDEGEVLRFFLRVKAA